MTKVILLSFFISLFFGSIHAQDTLWMDHSDKERKLEYLIQPNEDLFSIAKKFQVPPVRLADINQTNLTNGLTPGVIIQIPLGNYNYYRINSVIKSRPLYYKVKAGENLKSLSRLMNIPQSAIEFWNHLEVEDLSEGQILQLGWIAFHDDKELLKSLGSKKGMLVSVNKDKENKRDSVVAVVLVPEKKPSEFEKEETDGNILGFEEAYHIQTGGYSVNTESGACVFYKLNMHTNKGQYYALHESLPRGTIVKIENPATNKIIYAKIIGELPKINKYHNSIIALSSNARSALNLSAGKFFCNLFYR